MNAEDVAPEVSDYLRRIGSRGGKLGAAVTNAKLSPAQRKRNAKKAGEASAESMTPEERSARASNAAAERWAKVKASKKAEPKTPAKKTAK